jgi:hypothetical protein
LSRSREPRPARLLVDDVMAHFGVFGPQGAVLLLSVEFPTEARPELAVQLDKRQDDSAQKNEAHRVLVGGPLTR